MARVRQTLALRLAELAAQVAAGRVRRARPWGGADVAIVARLPRTAGETSFYPDPRFVVTPHAAELSWLFGRLGRVFTGSGLGLGKYVFYGRLADAAERYATAHPLSHPATGLLLAVLDEALLIATELESTDSPERPPII